MALPKLILTERDRQLIKRALQWPLVWRWAVRWAAAQNHSEYTKVCFPCAARDRLLKDKHAPTTGTDREVYCDKCGLHYTYWKVWRRCAGQPLLRHKVLTPVVRSFMMGW
jgi:hypothetical protein